jgi:hypothetical protein
MEHLMAVPMVWMMVAWTVFEKEHMWAASKDGR